MRGEAQIRAGDFLKVGVAAAGRGDLPSVRSLLDAHPDWLRRVGSHGRTMLWEAAYRGRLAVVEHLARAGADIDACGCHFTPLLVDISPYCAARLKRHHDVADRLLALGASRDVYTAAYLGDVEAVAGHLAGDAALAFVEKPQHDHNVRATALHYAVAGGHRDVVELLLAHGAAPAPYSNSLARFCIWRDRADLLEALLGAGLDAALVEPPRSGIDSDRILALLGRDDAVDEAEGGWPPLVFQCRGDRGGRVDRVRALIERGADANVRNYKGQAALHCAARAGFVDLVRLLLDSGAEVDAEDALGQTPLASTLRSTVKDKARLVECARLLVAAGADAARRDRKGRSPLDTARSKRSASLWLEALGRPPADG